MNSWTEVFVMLSRYNNSQSNLDGNFGSFPVPPPFVKLQKEMFKNCSHGNFHVRNVVKICSAVHADTF